MTGLLKTAREWGYAGKKMSLAIAMETWGSAPRQAGAFLIVCEDKKIEGSVSGGCVESNIAEIASQVISTGRPRICEYGVEDETAWGVGLSCGGRLTILVVPVGETAIEFAYIELIHSALKNRKSVDIFFDLSTIDQGRIHVNAGPASSPPPDQQSEYDRENKSFIWRFRPCIRLVIVGGGHISQALSCLAQTMDMIVDIVDPRSMFASLERFPPELHPNTSLHARWPQEILPLLGIDSLTAVVTLSHDPKIDDPAILESLNYKDVFYIGCLGNKRSHETRLQRLQKSGAARLDRIYGPVGLPIGGKNASEIALSILAEIVAVYHKSPIAIREAE